jgi:hypothetical protein
MNDTYFIQIKDRVANAELTPRSKFMLLDLIALRSNNWAPRRGEVNRIKLHGLATLHAVAFIVILIFDATGLQLLRCSI